MPLVPTSMTALPIITSFQDCASYSKVVEPYLPQLYTFANDFAASITDTKALAHLYTATNPAISAFAFSLALAPVFLLVSEVNKNYSQVDRVWSILPTLYNAHYAVWARSNGMPTQVVDNVLAFSVVWTIRLTYNYWRKGGYEIGSEDYRWMLVKKRIGQPAFFLLNVIFIALMQSVLLFLVSTPTYLLLLTSRLAPTMTATDSILARLLIALVVFEYFADGQMWSYQTAKSQYRASAKVPEGYSRAEMDRGFIARGLWRYSRHPNFAAEQLIWVVLYAWACWRTGTAWNWTVSGVVGYLGVFAGSTPLTEGISKGKYPEYAVYQQRVGRFLPKVFGKGWDEEEMAREQGKKK